MKIRTENFRTYLDCKKGAATRIAKRLGSNGTLYACQPGMDGRSGIKVQ